jgi:23S rRNA (cytosine1962-C5)-methyltransferase
VDSASNVVDWARRNALLAGLADRPIRWIVDDCVKFVRREVRRGRKYDAIILDPPSYGHGPDGEPWKLAKDLLPLLRSCAELVDTVPAFLLLTCHSASFGRSSLSACLQEAFFGNGGSPVWSGSMVLTSEVGEKLRSGSIARWATPE